MGKTDNIFFEDGHDRHVLSLLRYIPYTICCGKIPDTHKVSSIAVDSRKVEKGDLFIAVTGKKTDGHRYIGDAVKAGASVVIINEQLSGTKDFSDIGIPVIEVADTKNIVGLIASRFYGSPADRMEMIGITGTNGKTTISYLMEHVLAENGFMTAVIGTVEYRYTGKNGKTTRYSAPYTTPDPLILHARLKEMADAGVSHVVMEVSSHALHQKRLGPIFFTMGVFTNLSQDHLDYHPSMDEYFSAKCRLFEHHLKPGAAVIAYNPGADNPDKKKWVEKLCSHCDFLGLKTVVCGNSEDAYLRYLNSSFEKSGMSIVFVDGDATQRLLKSPLVGKFNVENLLLSLTALEIMGLETDFVCESLSSAQGAPGRLQRIELPIELKDKPMILVDFAHTPDALQNVLETVKTLPHRTLYCVFGCGGDRDRGKRPQMGRIAVSCADVAIITDDNPRSEEPSEIRAEVIKGACEFGSELKKRDWLYTRESSDRGCLEIGRRAEAIKAAVCAAGQDDIVVIAGKGHEQYQITSDGKIFFDDCLTARESCLAWDVESVAEAVGGTIIQKGMPGCLREISTDTRTINETDIFVALTGDRFDGHDFIESAKTGGAKCFVVARDIGDVGTDCAVIRVGDTLTALGDLAQRRRMILGKMNNPLVVGITGSCGKTTVKEMTSAIFQRNWPEAVDRPAGRVIKTMGNFNNLVGMPLSLLPASDRHRAIILEMGMNQPGEIRRLTEIANPTIGCITNIFGAHLEGLGSIEGVARAKGELFEKMQEGSIMVVNGDDPLVVQKSEEYSHPRIIYGISDRALGDHPDVWASELNSDDNGYISFTLHVRSQHERVTINSPGLHNCSNACAAAAIAHASGVDFSVIVAGLGDFRSASNRMEFLVTPQGLNLLNDTYNANPASMASGLETLAALPAQKRAAILGDMLELGMQSKQLHEELGHKVATSAIDYLGVIGKFAGNIVNGAIASGMSRDNIIVFEEKQSAADWVGALLDRGHLQKKDWLLVKASRGLALDTLVQQLMQKS